jgi:hypothetical protein
MSDEERDPDEVVREAIRQHLRAANAEAPQKRHGRKDRKRPFTGAEEAALGVQLVTSPNIY